MLKPTGQPAMDRRRFLFACAAAGLSGCSVIGSKRPEAEGTVMFSVVIRGGRVIDPGQGLDTSVDVGIEGGAVAALGANLRGRLVLDATGCVVAPGFVDLHSHAQSVKSRTGRRPSPLGR
jgi:hypothetical protein